MMTPSGLLASRVRSVKGCAPETASGWVLHASSQQSPINIELYPVTIAPDSHPYQASSSIGSSETNNPARSLSRFFLSCQLKTAN